MGLVLLTKGSQCFIGPVFTQFDPPTWIIIVKRKKLELELELYFYLNTVNLSDKIIIIIKNYNLL